MGREGAKNPAFGRAVFAARRVAALGTAVYFGFYVAGLAHDGRRMPIGDVGRAHPAFGALELALIALVTFHASSSLGVWVLERARGTRHHRWALVGTVTITLVVTAGHALWLYGLP